MKQFLINKIIIGKKFQILSLWVIGCICSPQLAWSQDFLCAEVKIEIEQELTLERQAFEARMRIINGLDLPLNNIAVEVKFYDADGNVVLASSDPNDPNPDVKFFITESGDGVSSSVAPQSDNRFTWLIIPTIAAGGESPAGQAYDIGATLTYTPGSTSDEERVDVIPDTIIVKPLPELALDYFLPFDVYADNPDTPTIIEPAEPFSLAVRIKNIGFGTAKNVAIDSAQPRIVENELGLLINFLITGTEINGIESPDTLLIDFGDIPPATEGYAGVARWIMETTLSGRFTAFTASVSHADELGGELTALISQENLNTHTLIREVLVDLTGRDARMDFLASNRDDPTVLQVFESNATETDVEDYTGQVTLNGTGATRNFSLIPDAGFSYVKFPDPFGGAKEIDRVSRADGKLIKPENAWLNRSWNKDNDRWDYFLHVFDSNNLDSASYTVVFRDPPAIPRAPVLQLIVDRTTQPGSQVGFIVQATDQNGDPVAIIAEGLPAGAQMRPDIEEPGRTSQLFTWTPTVEQTGTFALRFLARDPGGLQDEQLVHIFVTGESLTGFEAFIARNFGDEADLEIIGDDKDPDMDGMDNLAEYGQNTNPTVPDRELGPLVTVETFNDDFYLTITYRRRTDDPSLSFAIEGYSGLDPANPRTIETTSVTVSQDDVPEGLELLKIRDSVPLSDVNTKRFLELVVSRTD